MDKEIYESIVKMRPKVNLQLYRELGDILAKNPSIRFGQAISLFFLNDTNERFTEFESKLYNEEPAVTYARFSNNLKKDSNDNA